MALDDQEQPTRATGNASGSIAGGLVLALLFAAALYTAVDQIAAASAHLIAHAFSR